MSTADQEFYLYATPPEGADAKQIREWLSRHAANVAAADHFEIHALTEAEIQAALNSSDGDKRAFLKIHCGGKNPTEMAKPVPTDERAKIFRKQAN